MRTAVIILVTRLWCRHVLEVAGDATRRDFVDRFVRYASPKGGYGLKPSLLQAWLKGTHAVSLGSVRRVRDCVPGTAHVWLIAPLLKPKRLSAPAVARLMKDYIVTQVDGTRMWRFPNDAQLERENRLSTPRAWDDSERLVQRGDFFGMLAILALFRESAAQSRFDDIHRHAANLYRALPAVLRLAWVKPDVDLLLQCIENVMRTARFFVFAHRVDWVIFRDHLLAPTFEPNPRFWKRDPVSLQFLDRPADVIDSDQEIGHPRPVPLLPGVEPLAPYVIRPQPMAAHSRLPPKRIGIGRLLANSNQATREQPSSGCVAEQARLTEGEP